MSYALGFILLYLLFNVMRGWSTFNLLLVPAALDFGQALCCLLMLISGYSQYRAVAANNDAEGGRSMV